MRLGILLALCIASSACSDGPVGSGRSVLIPPAGGSSGTAAVGLTYDVGDNLLYTTDPATTFGDAARPFGGDIYINGQLSSEGVRLRDSEVIFREETGLHDWWNLDGEMDELRLYGNDDPVGDATVQVMTVTTAAAGTLFVPGVVRSNVGNFDSYSNEAGSGQPTASHGWLLPDDAYISSAETSDNAIVYRFGNVSTMGLAYESSQATGFAGWVSGAQQWLTYTGGFAPGVSGGSDLGTSAQTWDDTYTDDLYIQRTTATEGIIHGQGVGATTPDDELRIQVDNTSGQYDAWGFKFATAPNAAASVTSTRITSAGITGGPSTPLVLQAVSGQAVTLKHDDGATAINVSAGGTTTIHDEAGVARLTLNSTTTSIAGNWSGAGTSGTRALGTAAAVWDRSFIQNVVYQYAPYAADRVIALDEYFTSYTESTGTAVTFPSAVTAGIGSVFEVYNADAEGDDITVTSAGGNLNCRLITSVATTVTFGLFNADTVLTMVEQGSGFKCISDGTNWQCYVTGIGVSG